MWTDPRPLVFVNACVSAQITPEDLVDYLGAFVGKGRAAGLIGTEVKVEQGQAMELAESFFSRLFEHGGSLEQALNHTCAANFSLTGICSGSYTRPTVSPT